MEMSSNNLWVGNLKPEVTESELISLFHRYGNVDAVTSFSARSFAFVKFRNLNDAKAAKEALQGTVVRGNPLKIRFAKPADPCKSLWIAGIDQSVSKEELEKQFKKFGKIQELKFIKDHSTAYVEYSRVEDATEALKNMNGKTVCGRHIRLAYLRSQPAKIEHGLEYQQIGKGPYSRSINHPDTRVMPQDLPRGYPEILHAGSKRQNPFQLPTGRRREQPSKILWIRHPTSVHVDEDMLHNAMILFVILLLAEICLGITLRLEGPNQICMPMKIHSNLHWWAYLAIIALCWHPTYLDICHQRTMLALLDLDSAILVTIYGMVSLPREENRFVVLAVYLLGKGLNLIFPK